MVLLLVGALAVAAGRKEAKDVRDSKDDQQGGGILSFRSFRSLLPLSLGLQVLLRGGELLFQPQASFRTLVILLVLPTVGAVATAMLARRHGSAALIAAGTVLLFAPGWNVAATLGLAALAAVDLIAGMLLKRSLKPRNSLSFLGVWVASLLASTALLASYPWLRAEPLRGAITLFVSPPGWPILLGAILVLWALAAWRGPRVATGAAASIAFLAIALRIPSPGTSLLPPSTAAAINAAQPVWTAPVTEPDVETVVLESSLSNGAGLKNDTPVATVWLRGPDGRSASWILRAGTETGEWAARRPDVAAEAVLKSPPAWISYVAGDFFGQRYRSLWTVDSAGPFTSLSIERNPALPEEVTLDIHLLEVRK